MTGRNALACATQLMMLPCGNFIVMRTNAPLMGVSVTLHGAAWRVLSAPRPNPTWSKSSLVTSSLQRLGTVARGTAFAIKLRSIGRPLVPAPTMATCLNRWSCDGCAFTAITYDATCDYDC